MIRARLAGSAGLALIALGACTTTGTAPAFRNPDAPIASTTRFDPVAFAGQWHPVAGFGAEHQGAVTITQAHPGGFSIAQGAGAPPRAAALSGPGRFRIAGQAAERWVLWTDADYRTAVIGTPDGSFGQVWDRRPASSPDRLAAARDVLEWAGYDMTRYGRIGE
ncbi:lipocalin family protein [Brevirhabdus sp.]|uniref:lipocalin family protein n=1 Tax=Brevirhabdus sp. TaxID=2004514 RepID=UPI0040597365